MSLFKDYEGPFLSQKEIDQRTAWAQEVKDRHGAIRASYQKGGILSWFGGFVEESSADIRNAVVTELVHSQVIPQSHPDGLVPVCVSISSNAGSYERDLAESLAQAGSPVKVIAGDMSHVRRFDSSAIPMRFDASLFPFRANRIGAIFDRLGAFWYETNADLAARSQANGRPTTEYILNMFAELRWSLQPGGVIIVDDHGNKNSTTATKIDRVLGSVNAPVPGFAVSNIGRDRARMRVYRKIA